MQKGKTNPEVRNKKNKMKEKHFERKDKYKNVNNWLVFIDDVSFNEHEGNSDDVARLETNINDFNIEVGAKPVLFVGQGA